MKLQQFAAFAVAIFVSFTNGDTSPQDLALRMLASIENRGQATIDSGASTGFIQLGLFWQALAVVTESAPSTVENDGLRPLLSASLASSIPSLMNSTRDAGLPLDRFSLGAAMVASQNASFLPTIEALNASLELQPRNENGGLWYYKNLQNLTAYQNLSYLDGMYSFAPYITIQASLSNHSSQALAALEMALEQIQILHDICVRPSGLLVHGYDALKAHNWANQTSGASPEVWGRSLAWYSLGMLNTLEIAARSPTLKRSETFETLRSLFQETMLAQIQAAEHSKAMTNRPGVWQVVDRPGEAGNFVEASSSFMTVYNLLRGARLRLFSDSKEGQNCTNSAQSIAEEIYATVSQQYLITYANGTLSLNGTSSVASLSPQNVSYEYYVSRPTELDSLIGTSAFSLASYEMGKLQSQMNDVGSDST